MRHEPIQLREKRFNWLPYRFMHRGADQRVRRVERSWDVGARGDRGAGHYFRVVCLDGNTYDLFHDVALNAWFVHRPVVLWSKRSSHAFGKGKLRWNFT